MEHLQPAIDPSESWQRNDANEIRETPYSRQDSFQPLFPVAPIRHQRLQQFIKSRSVMGMNQMGEFVRDDVVNARGGRERGQD
jgi:hypothetical protein